MRLWEDSKGAVITDEQLLRYIAYRGSLAAALEAGDVRLVSDEKNEPGRSVAQKAPRERRLSEYLD